MMSLEVLRKLSELSESTKVIQEPEQNLRSKMDSLMRSIENLTAKKLRIDFELKKQKRSLARKRMELKKSHQTISVRLESAKINPILLETVGQQVQDFNQIDDRLLRESARILAD